MRHILVFAGTTEGRHLAEHFQNASVAITFCVATEYGKTLLPQGQNIHVLAKPMTAQEMSQLMVAQNYACVVDATHPYAVAASENISHACQQTGTPYLRLEREPLSTARNYDNPTGCVYVDSAEEAAAYLNRCDGVALLTTGSKELRVFTQVKKFQQRLFVRILPMPQGLAEAIALGYPTAHLYGMQGPFSAALNAAMLQEIKADFLITKESGKAGGFAEKLAGAKQAGAVVIIIKRPLQANGLTEVEMIHWIQNHYIDV